MMDLVDPVIVARLIFILGIINLVTVMLIFSSCRCIGSGRITGKLMKYGVYRRFFQYHCYLWWVFWPSVIIHMIIAIAFLGVTF